MFGWGRKAAVKDRAKQIARMVALIKRGMRTKTYEQFAASFSNPGEEPDAMHRHRREANFTMHISPTCWYNAHASYPQNRDERPLFLSLQGSGDDFGVFITAHAEQDGASVALHLVFDQKAGCDARAMARALLIIPGWSHARAMERALLGTSD